MIYVPEYNNNSCVVVINSTTLRVYSSRPNYNTTISYRDYYYTSNYLYNDGYQQFGNYSTLPTCIQADKLTNNYVYRNDFPQIIITFIVIIAFCYFLIKNLFKGVFKWL